MHVQEVRSLSQLQSLNTSSRGLKQSVLQAMTGIRAYGVASVTPEHDSTWQIDVIHRSLSVDRGRVERHLANCIPCHDHEPSLATIDLSTGGHIKTQKVAWIVNNV